MKNVPAAISLGRSWITLPWFAIRQAWRLQGMIQALESVLAYARGVRSRWTWAVSCELPEGRGKQSAYRSAPTSYPLLWTLDVQDNLRCLFATSAWVSVQHTLFVGGDPTYTAALWPTPTSWPAHWCHWRHPWGCTDLPLLLGTNRRNGPGTYQLQNVGRCQVKITTFGFRRSSSYDCAWLSMASRCLHLGNRRGRTSERLAAATLYRARTFSRTQNLYYAHYFNTSIVKTSLCG